jgi:hypothetical protein
LFAKIYNLATTRSRNFRVFVTGQSLDKNGRVLSTVTKVYQVFVKPCRNIPGLPACGPGQTCGCHDSTKTDDSILSQQVQIKYEGSM